MIGTNLAITTKSYAVAGGVTYDADALAYFTANTAITSDADKNLSVHLDSRATKVSTISHDDGQAGHGSGG